MFGKAGGHKVRPYDKPPARILGEAGGHKTRPYDKPPRRMLGKAGGHKARPYDYSRQDTPAFSMTRPLNKYISEPLDVAGRNSNATHNRRIAPSRTDPLY